MLVLARYDRSREPARKLGKGLGGIGMQTLGEFRHEPAARKGVEFLQWAKSTERRLDRGALGCAGGPLVRDCGKVAPFVGASRRHREEVVDPLLAIDRFRILGHDAPL